MIDNCDSRSQIAVRLAGHAPLSRPAGCPTLLCRLWLQMMSHMPGGSSWKGEILASLSGRKGRHTVHIYIQPMLLSRNCTGIVIISQLIS